jgi:hypothetical protein
MIGMLFFFTAVFIWMRTRKRTMKYGEILPADQMQKKYNLYAENRPQIRIDSSEVPENLRNLIYLAEKWGIDDDIIRDDFENKSTAAEKQELQDKLKGRTKEVNQWLDTFANGNALSESAAHFMYMLLAHEEMRLWENEADG